NAAIHGLPAGTRTSCDEWRARLHPEDVERAEGPRERATGGPPMVATGKPSYGTSTITDIIPYEFGGTVDLVIAPDGVRCRLELPVGWTTRLNRLPQRCCGFHPHSRALTRVFLHACARDALLRQKDVRSGRRARLARGCR